jgi:hypothetical protein
LEALHELVPLLEFMVVVLPTFVELVTFEELLVELEEFTDCEELTELDMFTVLAASAELTAPSATIVSVGPHAVSASATTTARYLIGCSFRRRSLLTGHRF